MKTQSWVLLRAVSRRDAKLAKVVVCCVFISRRDAENADAVKYCVFFYHIRHKEIKGALGKLSTGKLCCLSIAAHIVLDTYY